MDEIVGLKVKCIRRMTQQELDAELWDEGRHNCPTAIEFEDGTVLYASRDTEGNGAGTLFGHTKEGRQFALAAQK